MSMLDTVIPLGRGRSVKDIYFIDAWPLYYFDKAGQLINPWATGEFVDPTTLSDYDHKEIVPLQAGKPQISPNWDEDLLRVMVAWEDFARPDMQDQVNNWIASGLESYELVDRVKEAGGLITLSDYGLAPMEGAAAMPGTVNESQG